MPDPLPFPARLRHRVGWLGTGLLLLPALGWVWLVARLPGVTILNGSLPRYVWDGKLFSEPFNTVHAGMALDQPTIGKWLFWFCFMAGTSLPYAMGVGWVADRRRRSVRMVYGGGMTVLCALLGCLLAWPLCWLVQYVHTLGWAPGRALGLGMGTGSALLLGWATAWAWREPAPVRAAGPSAGGPPRGPGVPPSSAG